MTLSPRPVGEREFGTVNPGVGMALPASGPGLTLAVTVPPAAPEAYPENTRLATAPISPTSWAPSRKMTQRRSRSICSSLC